MSLRPHANGSSTASPDQASRLKYVMEVGLSVHHNQQQTEVQKAEIGGMLYKQMVQKKASKRSAEEQDYERENSCAANSRMSDVYKAEIAKLEERLVQQQNAANAARSAMRQAESNKKPEAKAEAAVKLRQALNTITYLKEELDKQQDRLQKVGRDSRDKKCSDYD